MRGEVSGMVSKMLQPQIFCPSKVGEIGSGEQVMGEVRAMMRAEGILRCECDKRG